MPSALFAGAPLELDATSFDKHVARSHIPVLVDFWAPWCGPRRQMAPAFAQAARELETRVRLAKLNTEDQQAIAARYAIRSIPTMILFQQGREVARISGALGLRTSCAGCARWCESASRIGDIACRGCRPLASAVILGPVGSGGDASLCSHCATASMRAWWMSWPT